MAEDPIIRALNNCDANVALEPGDPRYSDLDEARGLLRKRILRLFQSIQASGEGNYVKAAVAGHRGAGKTTELNRVEKELIEKTYLVCQASVDMRLDPREIGFSDIVRLLLTLLNDTFAEQQAKISEVRETFDNVRDWYLRVNDIYKNDVSDIWEKGVRFAPGVKPTLDVSAQAGIPANQVAGKLSLSFGELTAVLGIMARGEYHRSREVRDTIERYNDELIQNLNLLLSTLRIYAPERMGLGLVFLLDNVDKYDPSVVNGAFLRHADLFRNVEAHLIFTIQASLLHNPAGVRVDDCFEALELPMIPVFQPRSRESDPEVLKEVRDAVYKRVPAELFKGGDADVDRCILKSGGCWRDLLRLLHSALLDAEQAISSDNVSSAIQEQAKFYHRLIRSEAELAVMAKVHRTRKIISDPDTGYLLYHRCILAYNGEGWFDVHPLFDGYSLFQESLRTYDQSTVQLGS